MIRTTILLLSLSLALPLFAAQEVTVTVDTATKLHKNVVEVSPKLFGGFLEHMHTCIEGGLWAEILPDRKFGDTAAEGAPMGRFWRVLGDPAKVERKNNAVHLSPGGGEVGVELNGIYGVPGKRYRGTAYINTERFSGEIEFQMLHGDRSMDKGKARVPRIKGRFSTQALVAPPADSPCTMRFIVRGNGTFIIGAPTLAPASTTAGINPAVLPLLKQLGPTWLRWPGGNFAQTYHWRDGVGPRNDRPPRTNMAWPKGPVESNDFGTDEFLSVCRALQAEPVICVNVGGNGATAKEAAEWVAYCKRRGFKVKWWELGNEIYGHWEVGHSDAETYAQRALEYASAMKAADKSIKLIAVGHDLAWDRTVLEKCGAVIDCLAQHLCTNKKEYEALMAAPAHHAKFLGELREMIETACPGRDIRVSFNEWNLMGHHWHQWSLAAALFGAGLVHEMARTDGFVSYACSSDLINGWPGGAIQYEHGVAFLTPLGETLAAYRRKMPGRKLAFDGGNPALDILVTRSSSGSRYNIAVLNRDAKRDFEVKLDFGKWKPARLEEWTINSVLPDDKRDFSSLGNVPANSRTLTKGVADYRIPALAHSVTIVTFQK